MNIKVFRSNREDMERFGDEIRYWSNAIGELHDRGIDISEKELPLELQRAYKEPWTDEFGSLCYLVETPQGYGIALLNEYDECYADDCNLTMDELFQSALKDGEKITCHSEFQNANIYIGEYSGFLECHELYVIFPAATPVEEFKAAALLLDELAYAAAKKKTLDEVIRSAAEQVEDKDKTTGPRESTKIERQNMYDER